MSEVKRYRFISSNGDAAIPVVDSVKAERYVEEQDFDRVTAERDAALGRVAELESSFDDLAASVGFSEARLDQTGDSPIDCANQLQQRLTAAEALSVTRIMLDVVPGDGSGHEVFAKSVEDAQQKFTDFFDQLEAAEQNIEQLRDRRNSIVVLQKRVGRLEALLTAADERADSAITFVTRLIECAGGQPSIATGYLRDILDTLKPAEGGGDEN